MKVVMAVIVMVMVKYCSDIMTRQYNETIVQYQHRSSVVFSFKKAAAEK